MYMGGLIRGSSLYLICGQSNNRNIILAAATYLYVEVPGNLHHPPPSPVTITLLYLPSANPVSISSKSIPNRTESEQSSITSPISDGQSPEQNSLLASSVLLKAVYKITIIIIVISLFVPIQYVVCMHMETASN